MQTLIYPETEALREAKVQQPRPMSTGELLLWLFTAAISAGSVGAAIFACSSGARRGFVYRDEDVAPFK